MGVTIDEYNAAKEYHACVETIINRLWTECVKYHMLKDSYEEHLKADMNTMLTDLLSEIEEMPMYYDPSDVSVLIRQKINALYEEDKTEYKDRLKKSLLNDCKSCEAHYKDLMVDMLDELKSEFEQYEPKWAENDDQAVASCRTWEDLDEIIQQKINALKEEKITRKED